MNIGYVSCAAGRHRLRLAASTTQRSTWAISQVGGVHARWSSLDRRLGGAAAPRTTRDVTAPRRAAGSWRTRGGLAAAYDVVARAAACRPGCVSATPVVHWDGTPRRSSAAGPRSTGHRAPADPGSPTRQRPAGPGACISRSSHRTGPARFRDAIVGLGSRYCAMAADDPWASRRSLRLAEIGERVLVIDRRPARSHPGPVGRRRAPAIE